VLDYDIPFTQILYIDEQNKIIFFKKIYLFIYFRPNYYTVNFKD